MFIIDESQTTAIIFNLRTKRVCFALICHQDHLVLLIFQQKIGLNLLIIDDIVLIEWMNG